jgi:ferredoxin
MVDLRNLNQCDLDGECVSVCPTSVISLEVLPLDEPALTPAEAAELDEPATVPMKCDPHHKDNCRECA